MLLPLQMLPQVRSSFPDVITKELLDNYPSNPLLHHSVASVVTNL